MSSSTGRPRRFVILLFAMALLSGAGSLTAWLMARPFVDRATLAVRKANSVDEIGAAVQSSDYKTARRLNGVSTVLGIGFALFLVASLIARNRSRAVAGVLAMCTVWLGVSACNPSNPSSRSGTTKASRPRTAVSFPIQTCTFETFTPREKVSESARALMSAMGTGILNQEGGSLVRLQCPQGESFPGWIDSDGSLASALHGLDWSMMSPSHSPGNTRSLQVWEREGEGWVSAGGMFEDKTAEARSSKSTFAMYTVFTDTSLSEHSRRLLEHFGIGVAGESSTVIVKLGDFSGTGEVDADGRLRIIDETTWPAAGK